MPQPVTTRGLQSTFSTALSSFCRLTVNERERIRNERFSIRRAVRWEMLSRR